MAKLKNIVNIVEVNPFITSVEDVGCTQGLLALHKDPAVDKITCEECPFPFCVHAEARNIKQLAHNVLQKQIRELNLTTEAIKSQFNVGIRTAQRYLHNQYPCYWCMLDKFSSTVFCRPIYCTVARDGNEVVVVLVRHAKASTLEFKLIESLTEGLFPYGVLKSGNGSGEHEHWVISNVGREEADEVYTRMVELAKFAPALR